MRKVLINFRFMKFFSKQPAFTFVELLVSITIMAIVGGAALVSFGNFFENQDKNKVSTDLESTMQLLDSSIQSQQISDYSLMFSGGTLGYIVTINSQKKDPSLLIGLIYDFDTNSGTLTRPSPGKSWNISVFADGGAPKIYKTGDSSENFSLPITTADNPSFMIKSNIDGENTNYFMIHRFALKTQNKEPLRLIKTSPDNQPVTWSNAFGVSTNSGITLTFEQASKQFEITLQK